MLSDLFFSVYFFLCFFFTFQKVTENNKRKKTTLQIMSNNNNGDEWSNNKDDFASNRNNNYQNDMANNSPQPRGYVVQDQRPARPHRQSSNGNQRSNDSYRPYRNGPNNKRQRHISNNMPYNNGRRQQHRQPRQESRDNFRPRNQRYNTIDHRRYKPCTSCRTCDCQFPGRAEDKRRRREEKLRIQVREKTPEKKIATCYNSDDENVHEQDKEDAQSDENDAD